VFDEDLYYELLDKQESEGKLFRAEMKRHVEETLGSEDE